MEFETVGDRRLRYVPRRQSICGDEDQRHVMPSRPITVEGRIVRDVLEFDHCCVVIELDGGERTWTK